MRDLKYEPTLIPLYKKVHAWKIIKKRLVQFCTFRTTDFATFLWCQSLIKRKMFLIATLPYWEPDTSIHVWYAGRLQRDVVYLGWPLAPSYMRPKAGKGAELRGLSQWVQLYTGAQINFGDLTPYLTYASTKT
jgi:hypothetical protein